jgi:RAB6A-GEF complex partner protein 2
LSHDLMSPYIILNDAASISFNVNHVQKAEPADSLELTRDPETSVEDFVSFIGFTLQKNQLDSRSSHDYPTGNYQNRHHYIPEATDLVKSPLDSKLVLSDFRSQPRGKVNRFEILREGVFVAVVVLGRPAFRLGEIISVIIDFQDSRVRCHSLMAFLESSEIIDPAIALRSQASIRRATRRVYASHFDFSLFGRRATFNPIAPLIATPNFQTSSICLTWMLRFEFVISRMGSESIPTGLFDQVTKNEKGSVVSAVQILPCDRFEVTVPLNIYGSTAGLCKRNKTLEFFI